MRVGNIGGLWNPQMPLGVGNLLPGPGVGTYTLGSDGMVNLRYVRQDNRSVDLSGPIPHQLVGKGSDADAGLRQTRKLKRRFLAAYLGTILVAFVATSVAWSGSWGERVIAALWRHSQR
ncbi:MAG: hypothetical protein WAM97_07700 [Acidimicrobiales bacterium]